jgi:hypothetical protein
MRIIVTGHRPPRLCGGYVIGDVPWQRTPESGRVVEFFRRSLEGIVVARLQQTKAGEFMIPLVAASGMAQGADQLFCSVCLSLGIPYEAFVPYPAFSSQWPTNAQVEFQRLVSSAATVHYTVDAWYRGVETDRDRELVNWANQESSLVLAAWDGGPDGGTYATLRRAGKRSIEVWSINPRTGDVSRHHGGPRQQDLIAVEVLHTVEKT